VPDDLLRDTLQRVMSDFEGRQLMSRRMLAADVRSGTARVVRLIMDAYRAFESERERS